MSDDRSLILWKIEDKDYEKITKIAKISGLHDRSIYTCSINSNQNLIATVNINSFIFSTIKRKLIC